MPHIKTSQIIALVKRILAVPLPDDWDEEVITKKSSFAKIIRYATERAKKAGSGSSRVAFIVKYKNRDTILKIAKNKKGLSQNDTEADLLRDHYVKSFNIVIPMIDYDEKGSQPMWIHLEKADKITKSKFKKLTKVTMDELVYYCNYIKSGKQLGLTDERLEELHENKYCSDLSDLVMNYDIEPGDFSRAANWGLYKGDPVIIDIGLSSSVHKLHYSR